MDKINPVDLYEPNLSPIENHILYGGKCPNLINLRPITEKVDCESTFKKNQFNNNTKCRNY